MRTYECVYILDPSLEEIAVKEKTERFNEIITSREGVVHKVDPTREFLLLCARLFSVLHESRDAYLHQ